MHGLTITESTTGARTVQQPSLAVVGIVGTADDADPDVKANLATGVVANNNALTFTAKLAGVLGNAISVALIDPAANNAAIDVTVAGKVISVSLATSAGGAITTTAAQLAAAIAADADANALIAVANTGASTGAGVVTALAAALLTGGVDEPFPLDTPVLVTAVDVAAGKLGTTGTLAPAMEAIGDQTSPVVVLVRVAEGADQAETDANVIGATDGNSYTGIQALLAAQAKIGVRPRIIGAPGLDTQAVTAELVVAAKKLRAMVYAKNNGADVAAGVLYRASFGARELMLIWPDTSADFDGDAIARALGLRAYIDETQGWHKTLSNVPLGGVTALTKDVHWDLQDESTDAGVLNNAQVTTIIRHNGFRFWGNRTCAGDDQPEFSFESAVRTSHALQDIIVDTVMPFMDQPMTVGLIKDLLETANAQMRALVTQGRIVGALAWFDPAKNTSEQLAAGRPTISLKYTPAAPLENPIVELINTAEFYDGFADQLA